MSLGSAPSDPCPSGTHPTVSECTSFMCQPGAFQTAASALGPHTSENACTPFKSAVPISCCPLALLAVSPIAFQSLSLLVPFTWAVAPDAGLRPLLPQWRLLWLRSPSHSWASPAGVWGLAKLCLCPSCTSQLGSLTAFVAYDLSCSSLLLSARAVPLRVADFYVSVQGGEPRIPLFLPPLKSLNYRQFLFCDTNDRREKKQKLFLMFNFTSRLSTWWLTRF